MTEPIPAHHSCLDAILPAVWRLFARGVTDRRSAFHTPTLATIEHGLPALRTLVLRGFEPAARQLSFHTDVRSAKAAALARQPVAGFHVYDPGLKIQVRCTGAITLHDTDEAATIAWQRSGASARRCYAILPPPGSAIADPAAADLEGQDEAAARAVFLRVDLVITRLEWLYLASSGHRRARFVWTDGALSSTWLVP
jgi:pyridoxine/pyridoxamine 5'-phosphate oxidase